MDARSLLAFCVGAELSRRRGMSLRMASRDFLGGGSSSSARVGSASSGNHTRRITGGGRRLGDGRGGGLDVRHRARACD